MKLSNICNSCADAIHICAGLKAQPTIYVFLNTYFSYILNTIVGWAFSPAKIRMVFKKAVNNFCGMKLKAQQKI